MLPDGSLRMFKDSDVAPSTCQSQKSAFSKGKSRAAAPQSSSNNSLNPSVYMGFLMRFIRRELFTRNTKESVDRDYGMNQVLSGMHTVSQIVWRTDRQTDTYCVNLVNLIWRLTFSDIISSDSPVLMWCLWHSCCNHCSCCFCCCWW